MEVFLFTTYRFGLNYLKVWPYNKKLNAAFIDNRIVYATRFVNHVGPFFICLTLFWQYFFRTHLLSFLGVTRIVIMFTIIFALHLQGVIWLGRRARTALSTDSLKLYKYLYSISSLSNIEHKENSSYPIYLDLAYILQDLSTKHNDFWKEV